MSLFPLFRQSEEDVRRMERGRRPTNVGDALPPGSLSQTMYSALPFLPPVLRWPGQHADVDPRVERNPSAYSKGKAVVTSSYYARTPRHKSLDLDARVGTPLVAMADGKVLSTARPSSSSDCGGGVKIAYGMLPFEAGATGPCRIQTQYGHTQVNCGTGFSHGYPYDAKYTSLYCHMSRVEVRKGEYVRRGQVVGYAGSTGHSSGPHLHLQLTRQETGGADLLVDPVPYIDWRPFALSYKHSNQIPTHYNQEAALARVRDLPDSSTVATAYAGIPGGSWASWVALGAAGVFLWRVSRLPHEFGDME
jgi:murein DD-endopeptidase MepM/ murein hydrolase activator NlpD